MGCTTEARDSERPSESTSDSQEPPMTEDRAAHRHRITENNTKPATLALVRKYYPLVLASIILACCERQRAGIRRGCCRNPLCPACCPIDSRRIWKGQYAAFQTCTPPGKPGPRLAHEVYTLPPHLRKHVLSKDGFNAWKEATRATIREIHQTDVAGVMNLHAMGDEHIQKFHPHWDVVLNGYLVTDTGRIREHRPPYIDFDDARRIYTRHLVHAFHLEKADVPRVVDLWLDRKHGVVFREKPAKTRHLVRYSARHVYQPQFAWLNDAGTTDRDWLYRPWQKSKAFRSPGRAVINNLLAQRAWRKGRTCRVWFGYLAPNQRARAKRAFQAHRAPSPPAPTTTPPRG